MTNDEARDEADRSPELNATGLDVCGVIVGAGGRETTGARTAELAGAGAGAVVAARFRARTGQPCPTAVSPSPGAAAAAPAGPMLTVFGNAGYSNSTRCQRSVSRTRLNWR